MYVNSIQKEAVLVACGSRGNGPILLVRWQFQNEEVAWMFWVISNLHCSPICPNGVQVLDFSEITWIIFTDSNLMFSSM